VKTKIALCAGTLASLMITGPANAAMQFDGTFGSVNSGGSFTSSSLTLSAENPVDAVSGDFVGILPQFSAITIYSSEIAGLSTSPESVDIQNFFQIAAPGSFGPNTGAGTTPENRFDFNLATLAETSYLGSTADFSGTGTLVDTTGAYAGTPAYFNLSFPDQGVYSFSFGTAAVAAPESGIYGYCAGALTLLPLMASLFRTRPARG
jgi:hypothetical protein